MGENEGRTLTDFSAVRTFRQLGTWTGAAIDMEYEAIDREDPGDGSCAVLCTSLAEQYRPVFRRRSSRS